MQCLSAKGFQRGFGFGGELIRLGLEAASVDFIAEEGVPDGGEVDADLVGAPGLEAAGDQARHRRAVAAEIAFEHLPVRYRRAAAGAHGHLLAPARVAADRLIDGAARPPRRPPDQGAVTAAPRLAP